MSKFSVICADPPWEFSDKLTMSDVARGAAANYTELNISTLKSLPIKDLAEDDAILCLWVPSSLLQDGLDCMKAYGFNHKQTFIWVKTKNSPLEEIIKGSKKLVSKGLTKDLLNVFKKEILTFDLNKILSFYMGRLFRQTHEIVLIGTRGKIVSKLKNKSQRSVTFDKNTGHSDKPEGLQNSLELMFPAIDGHRYLELFARRQRDGWVCVGNDAPISLKEDILVSLGKLKLDLKDLFKALDNKKSEDELNKIWNNL